LARSRPAAGRLSKKRLTAAELSPQPSRGEIRDGFEHRLNLVLDETYGFQSVSLGSQYRW
jgi:hypothetical protein